MAVDSPNVREIFERALEHTSGAERHAYLDAACADQPELRDRVEALLKAHSEASGFLIDSEPTLQPTKLFEPTAEQPGTVIGPYKLMEQIGEGGFGLVFVAEQQHPIRRRVALKVIKPGMDTRTVVARFEAERQALALMDHPNIAKVFDAGATSTGRPFFVMELVRGVPITEYCDQNHITPRERLELFVSVCQAIQHAHQKGIIHRDVKPTNVLVTQHDGRPVAKVIDFGVAKALSQQLTERTIYTQFAQIIGTPLYMSPEQAEMSSLDIDTRSDIYSLGVLLYELLTGSTPFDRKRLATAAADEIRRIIREEDPPTPSTRFSHTGERRASVAAQRGTEPNKLSKILRGELDWIVMKALDKDRNRRYETAGGFAHDVERYLRNEPVQAGRPSAIYKFRKFAKKHFAALSVGIAFVLLLAAAAIVSSWQAVRATRAERQVAWERDQVIAEKDHKAAALRSAQAARDDEALQRAVAEKQRMAALQQERIAQVRLADGLIAIGDSRLALLQPTARDSYSEAAELARRLNSSELPSMTGLLASYQNQPAPLMGDDGSRSGAGGFNGHGHGRTFVDLSPDGRSAVSASTNGSLFLWNVTTATSKRKFDPTGTGYYSVKFAPDGASFFTGGTDGIIRQCDVATGAIVRKFGDRGPQIRAIDVSADGKWLVSGHYDFKVRVWDITRGTELHKFEMPSYVDCVAFSPDSSQVMAGGEPSVVRLWNLPDGKLIHEFTNAGGAAVVGLAFSPDGRSALIGCLSHDLRLLDVATGQISDPLEGQPAGVLETGYSPDGRYAFSAGYDRTIRLWDVATGKQLRVMRGHSAAIHSATFSRDGRFILSADEDGALKLWNVEPADDIPACHGHTARVISLAIGLNGRAALSGGFDKSIRLWDVATCLPLRTIATGDSPVWGVSLSQDCRTALSSHQDGTVAVWDVASGNQRMQLIGHTDNATSVALSPDEKTVLSSSSDKTIKHWDLATGMNIRTLPGHGNKARKVLFVKDGSTAISGGFDNLIKRWDLGSGAETKVMRGHSHWIFALAITSDGKIAASGSNDRRWALWDVESGENLHFSDEASDVITAAAFSPNSDLLFIGCMDGHAGLYTVADRQLVRDFELHSDGVTSTLFCSGNTALSGSRDGLIRRWEWDRPARYQMFTQSLSAVRKSLASDPDNADALAMFGRWYAFRGVHDWAIEFLEKARRGGAKVSSIELAREYWHLDRRSDAEREFQKAKQQHEAPDDYLALCIQAVDK